MDNKKKKIIVATIISIILVIAIVLLTIKLINIRKNKQDITVINENLVIENKMDSNNEINNEPSNETQDSNEIQNNIENNTIDEDIAQNTIQSTPVADPEQEVDKQTIQQEDDNKEKAINIAKKDWGEDNSVYFSFEGVNNGKYTVSVRETDTTRAIRYYHINVSDESFETEE